MAAASITDLARELGASSEWPRTEPIGADRYDDSRVRTRPAVVIPPRSTPAAVVRPPITNTVIPVPALPTIATSRGRLEPVRSTHGSPASALRLAKGTGPVDPPDRSRPAAVVVEDVIPNLSVGDRTKPGVAIPPARTRPAEAPLAAGDRTKPGIALTPAARAVQLPSVKRRMSPR